MANYLEKFVSLLEWKTDPKGLKDYEKGVDRVGKLARRAAGFLAGMFSVNYLRNQANAIDATAKFARSINATTEELHAMKYAADRAGVQNFEQGLQRMARRASQAARGGGVLAKTLNELNINAQEFAKLKAEDQFLRLGEAIAAAPEEQQLSYAFSAFDMGGRSMLNMMRDLDTMRADMMRAQAMGITLTEDESKAVEAANDAFGDMGKVLQGISNVIIVTLAPYVERLSLAFADLWITARPFVEGFIVQGIDSISDAMSRLWQFIQPVITAVDDLVMSFGGWQAVLEVIFLMLVGAKIMRFVGSIAAATKGVKFLRGAMIALGKTVPFLILTGAALIAQDIWTGLRGGDSKVFEFLEWLEEKLIAIKEWLVGLKNDFTEWIDGMVAKFNELKQRLKNIASEIAESIKGMLPDWMLNAMKKGGELISTESQVERLVDNNTAGGFPMESRQEPAAVGGNTNNVSQDVTIQIDGAQSPTAVANEVQEVLTKDALRAAYGGIN